MFKLAFILAIMIDSTISRELYQIEKLFLQNYPNLSSLALPQIAEQKTIDSELADFTRLHQKDEFKNFNPNPEFSAQILLKKENNWNQSIYLHTRQQSRLLLEVKVTHKQETHQYDNQSIELYVVSLQKGEVIYSNKVKRLQLANINVEPGIYQIRVAFNWKAKEAENSIVQQLQKHIKIDADFINVIKSGEEGENSDQKKAHQKLRSIKNETDRIFVSSLQIWDEVQSHHQQHFMNQQGVYLRAYIEIIGVFVVNMIEIMALKKTLKIQSIV